MLAGALFALFMTGFWLYSLTDAILTPASQCRGLPKPAWVTIIMATFIGGAVAWLIVRPRPRGTPAPLGLAGLARQDRDDDYFRPQRWTAADDALARHPAGRARAAGTSRAVPKGPDDDLDFLRALDRMIRGNSQAGGEA